LPRAANKARSSLAARSHLKLVGEGEQSPSPSAPDIDSDVDAAREIALKRLTYAPKTKRVLTRDLVKRGVSSQVAEQVVDRMAEVGLIDDAAFAQAWVSTRHSGRGLARRALRSELRLQGVADEVASEAVEVLSTEDEFARARQLVLRRIRATGSLGDEKQIRRLSGMLQRKGYSLGLISAVLRDVAANPT